jgi:hypothetical protein
MVILHTFSHLNYKEQVLIENIAYRDKEKELWQLRILTIKNNVTDSTPHTDKNYQMCNYALIITYFTVQYVR